MHILRFRLYGLVRIVIDVDFLKRNSGLQLFILLVHFSTISLLD